MQARNILLFILCSILVLLGWIELERRIWPPKPVPTKPEEKESSKVEPPKEKPPEVAKQVAAAADAAWAGIGRALEIAARPAKPRPETVTLGSDDPATGYYLRVKLDPMGAAVRSVLLNKFKAANQWGQPTDRLLELVPELENFREGSFVLYHYANSDSKNPLDTLGKMVWDKVEDHIDKDESGREKSHTVAFRASVDGVQITKTFTLAVGDYHVGLAVTVKREKDSSDKPLRFRYQLAGAHGLPVEGKWYTSVFRNALIGRVDRNSVLRDLQDLRQISVWGGGKEVAKEKSYLIRYAAVAVQFFASGIVVDDVQDNGVPQDFVAYARPTLETYVLKGRVKKVNGGNSFVLTTDDQKEQTIYPSNDLVRKLISSELKEGSPIAVVATTDGHERIVAEELANYEATQPMWIDDITVRVTTEPIELRKPGDEVTHRYLLYNGPVKPSLLGMPGHESVAPELLDRYIDKLKLNTLTDYQSPGFFGTISSSIYWTDLIIKCTNIMHWVLSQINRVIPNYGLCIICLTILVRGLMFPVSRRQAMMSIKMQQLAPEMKKIQEKHKGDRQAIGMATMELYRKHKVNPFGTCWFLILQMPIFMGLYFALQESIYFRLAGAFPTWIHNLAAPDMLYGWGQNIPWISRPHDYGSLLYLGPFLNLLPIIAVVLMIMQQKMMTPPPQDEQQAMQQKVMKYMMVFFGLMFYKVAAGLCLYFIASSLWGFTERKLLPKKSLTLAPAAAGPVPPPTTAPGPVAEPSTAVTTAPAPTGGRGRRQGRGRRRQEGALASQAAAAPPATGWMSRLRRRVSDWWEEMQRRADKR